MSEHLKRRAEALEEIAARHERGEVKPMPWKKDKQGYQLTKEASFRRRRAIAQLEGDDSPTARKLVENLRYADDGRSEGGKATLERGYLPNGEKTRAAVRRLIQKRRDNGQTLRGIAGILSRSTGRTEGHLRKVILAVLEEEKNRA